MLSIIFFLHQTTTLWDECKRTNGCLLSSFYIKPQPSSWAKSINFVVYYLLSTSNHNLKEAGLNPNLLSIIFFLHQTTTGIISITSITSCLLSSFYIKPQREPGTGVSSNSCLLSSFYIKPQPSEWFYVCQGSCLLSSFYIKPQLSLAALRPSVVVYYLLSTSNHNHVTVQSLNTKLSIIFFLHQTTTS